MLEQKTFRCASPHASFSRFFKARTIAQQTVLNPKVYQTRHEPKTNANFSFPGSLARAYRSVPMSGPLWPTLHGELK